MNNSKSHLFLSGCILMALCSPAYAVNLVFGQVATGAISLPAQSNSYTFSANAGDVVDFTMFVTSGNLIPYIRLYNPSGTLIDSNYSGSPFGCSGSTLEMNQAMLAATGTYTVLISDCASTNTGSYSLYAQRINNPTGAVTLPIGQTEPGTISLATQSNTYTFSANANAVVDFTLTTTSGSLVPKIRLYNSASALVASNYGGSPFGCSGTTLELNTVTLATTGVYTVLLGDCSDTNSGNYEIYTQITDAAVGPTGLLFGQTQAGSIALAAQSNTYTFAANASDVVDFTLVSTSGSLLPKIRVYNPAGALIASNYGGSPFGCSGTTLELNTVTLTSAGTYTVLIGDCGDTNAGNYTIYSQRTNNPTGATNLPFAQTQTGLISSIAQSSSYTFSASADDVVDFTLVSTSGSLVPKIRLYNPAGALVASNYGGSPFGCSGTTLELNTVTLLLSGTYTVLVGDCGDTNLGNYAIYSQRTKNPVAPIGFLWGQVQSGKISSVAQSDTYTFGGSANDSLILTMITTSGSLVPKIRLYGPTGEPVSSNYSGSPFGCSGTTTGFNPVALPSTGTYTLLVGDCGDTNTGSYNISTQCIGVCPVTIAAIAITAPSASIVKGNTEQFTATGTYSDSSTANVTAQVSWSSSNPAAATIGTSGLATGVAAGTSSITASLSGITSSAYALTVTAPPAPAVVSVSPSSGSGATQTFAAVYSDANGTGGLSVIRVLFNTSVNSTNACYVLYYPSTNLLYLENNGGTGVSAGVAPGSSAQASNSQCTLMGTGSSYATSGNNATLNVALTFSGTFLTQKNVYLLASDVDGTSSGWVQKGVWGTTLGPPTVVTLTPNSGSGTTQTFTGVVSDPNGAADLATVRILFNTSINSTNACYVIYYPGTNLLYLENNTGTGVSAGVTPGSAVQVSNSQCTLAGTGSSYSATGSMATLSVSLTFSGTFIGLKNVYLLSSQINGTNSGWGLKGTWTTGASIGPPTVVSLTPNSGSGTTQTFTGVYSDPNGATDLATVRILFNAALTSAHGCYVTYYPSLNLLYLQNDGGTGTSAGVTPGSTAQVSNSQCTLMGAGSSYAVAGGDGTLSVALTFNNTFVTQKNVYLLATETNGSNSGWTKGGSWTP